MFNTLQAPEKADKLELPLKQLSGPVRSTCPLAPSRNKSKEPLRLTTLYHAIL